MAVLLILTKPIHIAQADPNALHVALGGDCGGASPCYATIQAAVDAASDSDTIKVTQGTYTSTGFQVVYVNKAITLTGGYSVTDWVNSYPITRPTVIDAEDVTSRRGVHIDGTGVATITLAGLTVQRGYAQDSSGGGVCILTGTVVLRDTQVLSSTATGFPGGGGVYVANGVVTLGGNFIRGNAASSYGGGVLVSGGTATLSDNTIQDNSGGTGAGVFVLGGTVTLDGNTVFSNTAGNHGGGVALAAGIVALDGNTIVSNTANGNGAGVYTWRGHYPNDFTLSGNAIRGNVANQSGGGVYVESVSTVLEGNTFQGNSASQSGGGIYVHESNISATLNRNIILSLPDMKWSPSLSRG